MITLTLPISSVLNLMATSKSVRNSLLPDIDLIAKTVAMRPAKVEGGRQWSLPVKGEEEVWMKGLIEGINSTQAEINETSIAGQRSEGEMERDLFPNDFPWYSYLQCSAKWANFSMRNRKRIWSILDQIQDEGMKQGLLA